MVTEHDRIVATSVIKLGCIPEWISANDPVLKRNGQFQSWFFKADCQSYFADIRFRI